MDCARVCMALGLAAVLGLVGCGQQDVPADTSATVDTATVEPPAPAAVTISGLVESTDAADFATRTTERPGRAWPNLLISPAYAQTAFVSVSAVPVRVYPIASAGYVYGPPVATTTTTATGSYEVVMPPTYAYQPRTEYVVVAGTPVIEDRVDDWGDLGDAVLRRLVTGLVDQVVSPVSEIVYRQVVPAAQTQWIDVRTIPVVQVEQYHTYVQNQVQGIDFQKQHGLRNALAHIEQNLAKHQDWATQRDTVYVNALRLSDEQRRDEDHYRKAKGPAWNNRNKDKPKSNSGGGQGNNDKPKANSGNDRDDDDKPKSNSGGGQGNGDRPKANSGGGQGNNDKPKANSGGGQGNDDRPKGNSGGGQGGGGQGNDDKPKGNSGGGNGGGKR